MCLKTYIVLLMSFLSVATLNVNGLRNNLKRSVLFEFLERKKFDLIFLQETHSEMDDEVIWSNQWHGNSVFNHGNRQSRGVAILTSFKSGLNVDNIEKDNDGRWLKGEINWNNINIFVASVYAPNEPRQKMYFLDELADRININDNDNWILGGDFNIHLDNVNSNDGSRTILQNVINEKDLCDAWRTAHPESPGITHYHKATKTTSRIDHLFISSNLRNYMIEASVHVHGLSDHHVVNLKLNDVHIQHGSGRWMCNNSLLKDGHLLDRLQNLWNFWRTQKGSCDTLTWWDIGKFRIKEILQDHGKEKAWEKKRYQKNLQKRYNFLINNPDKCKDGDIQSVEDQLKNCEIDEWRRARIRVKNILKEESEKPSRYFLNLEKEQIQSSKIEKLLKPDGNYTSNLSELFECVNNFYGDLYSSEEISQLDLSRIISKVEKKSFSDEVRKTLESKISLEEVKQALFHMNKNKSPGHDGLTVEFYQAFWETIGTDLVEVFEECYELGVMSDSMNEALIRLIYKRSGDKYDLKNWRPISLLNVDYKILSEVITNRMRLIMPIVIGDEQSSGVPNRNIHENLMVVRDVVDFVNWNNLQGAVISLDQEKAFDRINWVYMFSILEKMGVPPNLIDWIHLLYSNPNCSVIINNFIGRPIQVTRGIRQGCPLSPLLYSICAEGLTCLIRTNCSLKGIKAPIGDQTVRLIQHADDTNLFVSQDTEFEVIQNILFTFCHGSGSDLNVQKTKGLWLGAWRNRVDSPCDFSWHQKMKILGVVVGNDVSPEDNWGPRINRIKCVLQKWSKRNLSYYGKAVVVNSFVGAGINYIGSVVACPLEFEKKISSAIWEFFWDGKMEKIKRDTVIGPKNNGGAGLIDIHTKLKSLKLQWIVRYVKGEGRWKLFFDYWINRASADSNLGWYIFANPRVCLKTTKFYEEVIQAFQSAGGMIDESISCYLEACNMPLYDNSILLLPLMDHPLIAMYLEGPVFAP